MSKSHLRPILVLIAPLIFIAACSSGEPAATPTPTITPTAFPTYAFVQYTTVPQVAAAATEVSATEVADTQFVLDPQKVEYGRGRWDALECGSCHGENGEGTDKGSSLLDYTASEAEFVDFMRTGGSVGNSHRYPAEKLSNSGASNLYQYVRSLGG